jgi:hypothetical protein
VENDQGGVAGSLCGYGKQIVVEVTGNQMCRVVPSNLDGGVETFAPLRLLRPYQRFEPADIIDDRSHRAGSGQCPRAKRSPAARRVPRRYDVAELRRRQGGRPSMGTAPASVESVRLDPDLKRDLLLRAAADGTSVSEVIRRALREYVQAS